MHNRPTRFVATVIGVASMFPIAARVSAKPPTITYIGKAVIGAAPQAGADKSGLPHKLLEDGKSFQDTFDGFGSAIAYTGYGNRYILLPDRGPNKFTYAGGSDVDNTTSYINRFQVVDIAVTPNGDKFDVTASLQHTSLLTTESGEHFVGLLTAPTRFDSEGARAAPDGTVWISDEYGPFIYQFESSGRRIGQLNTPKNISIDKPGNEEFELANNKSGRYPNKGAEGLAITPDGHTLVAAMQSPLLQDGGKKGVNTRFLVYDLTHKDAAPRQLVYPLNGATGISELLAINDHQFLVDERGSKSGDAAVCNLYLIDLKQASPPSNVADISLPKTGLPSGVVAMNKTLFADLKSALASAKDAFVNDAGQPEKIEGIAFGPDLPDGRHLLLVTNDNDFSPEFPNYIWAFAVDPASLPGFQPVKLNAGVTFAPGTP